MRVKNISTQWHLLHGQGILDNAPRFGLKIRHEIVIKIRMNLPWIVYAETVKFCKENHINPIKGVGAMAEKTCRRSEVLTIILTWWFYGNRILKGILQNLSNQNSSNWLKNSYSKLSRQNSVQFKESCSNRSKKGSPTNLLGKWYFYIAVSSVTWIKDWN